MVDDATVAKPFYNWAYWSKIRPRAPRTEACARAGCRPVPVSGLLAGTGWDELPADLGRMRLGEGKIAERRRIRSGPPQPNGGVGLAVGRYAGCLILHGLGEAVHNLRGCGLPASSAGGTSWCRSGSGSTRRDSVGPMRPGGVRIHVGPPTNRSWSHSRPRPLGSGR
jgi:hypothetical protein